MQKEIIKRDMQNIMNKLNFMEQNTIRKYIESNIALGIATVEVELAESEKRILEQYNKKIDEVLNIFDMCLKLAIRENKVSEERYKKIIDRYSELVIEYDKSELIGFCKNRKRFKVLDTKEYEHYIEHRLHNTCRFCNKRSSEGCDFYKELKMQGVPPYDNENKICEYKY